MDAGVISEPADDGDLFDLSGRVAVVTGGSRGLGRAMCTVFARHGARVVVVSRNQEACDALAAELTERTGNPAVGIACHVGRWTDCDSLAEKVLGRFGAVDVLVNNAGLSPTYPSLTELSEVLWDKVFGVNLKGPFRLSALLGERMAEGAGGSIINVSSTGALEPRPDLLPYAASKAGLDCLTLGLARALAPKVRVNAIMPGPFLTDMRLDADSPEWAERVRTRIPLRRGGTPSEVAGAALYLASAASSFTTGAIIKIDGGSVYAPA